MVQRLTKHTVSASTYHGIGMQLTRSYELVLAELVNLVTQILTSVATTTPNSPISAFQRKR